MERKKTFQGKEQQDKRLDEQGKGLKTSRTKDLTKTGKRTKDKQDKGLDKQRQGLDQHTKD